MKWTPEAEMDLRRRWLEGQSASEIGEDYGLTRGGVMKKLDRLGLLGIKRTGLSAQQAGAERAMDRRMARATAAKVNAYWAERGYDANARAVESLEGWEVQSDLVNGLPTRRAA